MARETRSQRRARRDAGDAASVGAGAGALAAGNSGAGTPPPVDPTVGKQRRGPFKGPRRFIGECIGELKKVDWPTQPQVVTGTTVVLIACLIVGVFLYLNDQLWKYVVEQIILR